MYQPKIKKLVFEPFIRYFLVTCILMTFFMGPVTDRSPAFHLSFILLNIMVFIDAFSFFSLELIQLSNSGLKEYVLDSWNILD